MSPFGPSKGKAHGHPDLLTSQSGLSGPSGFSQISSGLNGFF